MFVELYPSKANETWDGPTIRRCIAFAKAWGYGGPRMTNLFTFRTTFPALMKTAASSAGPENDETLCRLAQGQKLWCLFQRQIGNKTNSSQGGAA